MNKTIRNKKTDRIPIDINSIAYVLFVVLLIFSLQTSAQVGQLLWEENFNSLDPDRWTIDVGDGCDIGLCGWGNQELQSYGSDNVSIASIPGEAGNFALVLEARNESVGNSAFTSGKIQSKNKIAVQYGLVEIRLRVPNLDTGLWPAAWMLGTATATWPAKGEIDIMEMGHAQAARARQGFSSTPVNNYVGSNLIFYAEDACNSANPSCAASSSWDVTYNSPYASSIPMSERFLTYRLYWTEDDIRFTVLDNGVEFDLHDSPFPIGGEADEFQAPFYFLLNLAVGGNFTDALSNGQVTAPRPAKMYVDYIRVYQYEGQGQVFLGDTTVPETGTFGVFTENTSTNNSLSAGVNSDIWVWDSTTSDGTSAPFEGSNVIAWNINANTWFGGGIQSRQPLNMSNFNEGNLKFKIKIPGNVSFRIGITDTYTNENWLSFPANETRYGLVRNGAWGEVTIPVADLRGSLIALQSLSYPFAIVADPPGLNFELGIDDIYWEGGGDPINTDSDGDGVSDLNDQCPSTPVGTEVDLTGCKIAVPVDVLLQAEDYTAYSDADTGNNGGAYRSDDVDLEVASDIGGGFNVGWTRNGEWLEYRVNLVQGTYDVTSRVASRVGGGRYTLELDNQEIGSGTVAITGGWQAWESNSVGTVTVASSGERILRVNIISGSFNLNWLEFTVAEPPQDSDNDGVTDDLDSCPGTAAGVEVDASGCPIPVPEDLLVQAEDYSAYFDTDVGNNGGAYRSDNVDIENSTDNGGGFNVGWTSPSEWLEYDIDLIAGTYDITTRVASNIGGGSYTVSINGTAINEDAVANTGGWQSWQTHSIGTVIVNTSGRYTLRIDISGGLFNLNWINFLVSDGGSPDPDPVTDSDSDGDGVEDSLDRCPGTNAGTPVDSVGCPIDNGASNVVPLYDATTNLEPVIQFDRGDALVTRFSDRARDRHAREDQFQIYDHFLSFYWEDRTAAIEIVDYVAKGGDTITMNVRTQFRLHDREAENRWWFSGRNTVAEYMDNGTMDVIDEFNYTKSRSFNPKAGRNIRMGDRLEFEISQFLDPSVPNGRSAYYGTTFLYIVGEGIVPWYTDPNQREDSFKIPEQAWLGGKTTLPYMYSAEPDNHFMQMATNLGYDNAQPFVLGRRLHHTNFVDGSHDEIAENGIFPSQVGKAGTHFINTSCSTCHERNGRATPLPEGQALDKWVFKVGDANGNPDPNIGRVLQPRNVGINSANGEGSVAIDFWTESNGLRKPNYAFSRGAPASFSARIAPQLVGLGLLEAIPESRILSNEDVNDSNGDGVSGRAQRVQDPTTGQTRLGRFGWKAATSSVQHQVAAALNTDIGVMTSVLPTPDCGASQSNCGGSGAELNDGDLENLVKYISLLGVRPQRDYANAEVQNGKRVFINIGCEACHTESFQTSSFHPLSELRDQTIYPYTDMLLHDMGPGLADNLGEGSASGAEWRTTPLWGIGLSACVSGGVTNPTGAQGDEVCTPKHSYLHDGRARSIDEAIRWHGGEGERSKQAYENLSNNDKNALLRFLNSL